MADQQILSESVRTFPTPEEARSNLVFYMAQSHDIIEPWDGNAITRDKQLSQFWLTEPFLASAVTSIAMTRAALSWEVTGPPKMVNKVHNILNTANFTQGWQHIMMMVNIDLLTTENGAFIEVIRKPAPSGRKPESMPVLGIAHLPSTSCIRTGNPIKPVIYIDKNTGEETQLYWYQVIMITENPVPYSETGRQFCFVSRVLKFSQIIRDILVYQSEKVSGRFTKAIHVVAGISQSEIENIQRRSTIDNNNAGLFRYGQPLILTTIDPNAKLSKETIDLATMPDGFDFDSMLNWYITLFALASGSDYQEFAPLSSGNLGTASQSDTLHRKSQKKGTQLFIKSVETGLIQNKVIPSAVSFRFKQQDAQAEMEQTDISKTRAETRKLQLESGEIDIDVARQLAVDKGDLRQEHIIQMGNQTSSSTTVTVADDEQVSPELLDTVENTKSVWLADAAAKYFIHTIASNKLQSISPIPEVLLYYLKDELRKAISVGKLNEINTKDNWLPPVVVQKCIDCGIDPVALRLRLPDNLLIRITDNSVIVNGKEFLHLPQRLRKQSKANNIINTIASLPNICYNSILDILLQSFPTDMAENIANMTYTQNKEVVMFTIQNRLFKETI